MHTSIAPFKPRRSRREKATRVRDAGENASTSLLLRGVLVGVGVSICLLPAGARAGDWGLTVAYNNPAGANIGANLMYLGQVFAFEAGVGGGRRGLPGW
jgi:hypothetical protein